ncbi:PilT/PilU family type 4a pilus ATPase [Ramlibacter rhizophilus]|uniref:PilT/PilU family type 4a pilus ATPase n=2 Tax=Ramlibacter rhizophilus TaxID=1781167 RepID=A0A4Z0C3K7_9BURK|nr:PilT/PilU family type 4a pilus ATPase [Ramlibacter rhizophilus]
MVRVDASDLFMTVGAHPTVKIQGRMHAVGSATLASGAVKRLAYSAMSDNQRRDFERDLECDLALTVNGLGRFRFNVYVQRGEVSMVVRHVKSQIPSVGELRLPAIVERLAMLRQGLVLVVGSAGSGKSTTLAAMLEHRNRTAAGHILTVEDPIEFIHEHGKCIVDQREVGLDTRSFSEALRRALREAPDVIMIGEIRDEETMRHALHYAETGHLCVSTLHANNANQAIERVINFFPETGRRQILMDLSLNLKGVVAQRLVQGTAGRRVPATEVMLLSAYISELIQKGEVDELKAVIAKSNEVGMHSFDQSLHDLYQRGDITLEEALEHADSKTDLSLRVRLHAGVTMEAPPNLSSLRKRRSA